MPLFLPAFVFPLVLPLAACAQSETPRKPPRLLTNEQGCSITIDNQPINPYQDPSPIERACVGPHLLELPQNYYSTQMGPQHDGSFRLALEYPSLQPFKPGERMNLSADVSVRTVSIDYAYIDRIDVWQAFRNAYTPRSYERDDPAASLETRIKGSPVHGLVPYYADLERIRARDRRALGREREPGIGPWYQDWFVVEDATGQVATLIKCTSREATDPGVEFRGGKLVKNSVQGVPECTHFVILPDYHIIMDIRYPRMALASWSRMQERARRLFIDNIDKERRP